YRDDEGKPFILPVVAWAEQNLPDEIEHLSIFGYQPFTEAACRLLMGDNHDVFCRKKVFGIQCISGTGGLRLAGDYLLHVLKYKNIYIPSPSFGNHEHLYNYLGFEVRNYRYWDYEKQDIDFNSLIQDLTQARPNSVVLLHACAHNPTGRDLSRDQWMMVCQTI
uniref:aspartate transaminase n=1 Tax=Romanomermis culicivorax TaxID=13658 RepID=A0A915L1E5_ROMCU